MSTPTETAPSTANARGRESSTSTANSAHNDCAHKPKHKWQRTLSALLEGHRNSFHLEKAPTFDHCPNSTVSELKKRHGLVIYTQMVHVPGYENQGALIAEYRLADESRAKAEQLVRGLA